MPSHPLPDAEAAYQHLRTAVGAGLYGRSPAIIGVHSGGAWIAERLARDLSLSDLGFLDISFYRDDFSRIGLHPQVRPTAIDFDLDNRDVLLVDDVLYTGRTVRAALNALFDYGRPAKVELAVLVDRHHEMPPDCRELPVAPTYAGAALALPAGAQLVLSRDDHNRFTLAVERG